MSDVRALLRNELAARLGTEEGATSTTRGSKKRKLDSEQEDLRKRQRPTVSPSPPADRKGRDAEPLDVDARPESRDVDDTMNHRPDPTATAQKPPDRPEVDPEVVDDDEWAAFEREVAAPSRMPAPAEATISTNATISAAPVSASQLAERERQERESRASALETTMLGEREDATRLMEEEFDEMEELEEKVRRLKEKRDEIRRRKEESETGAGNVSVAMETEQTAAATLSPGGSEDESDEEDEWDNWRFRSGR